MIKRKICVVTGTRAEYGLLYWLMKEIQADDEMELQLVVTGMHLSPEFGLTYKQIEKDGFRIDGKVEMLLSSDTAVGIAKSMGLATIGFADAFERLKPDIIVILGDRFEMLAVAQTAMISRIPIAHIHGGEITAGAYDDAIRHSITKISSLHFTSTKKYRRRVIQIGEQPNRVFNVGSPGVDNIFRLPLMSREELSTSLNVNFNKLIFLLTYHPVTLNKDPSEGMQELFKALEYFSEATIIFTKGNSDNDGRKINQLVEQFVSEDPFNRKVYTSLGQQRYLSLVKHANLVIGNSSSGLLEAPYLRTATVNIGERQKGRDRPESVIDCTLNREDIILSINKALKINFNNIDVEIFGDGNSSRKILELIKSENIISTAKDFFDWEGCEYE